MTLKETIERRIIHPSQVLILNLFYIIFSVFTKRGKQDRWVVGVDEMAGILYDYGNMVGSAYTVSLSINPYYDLNYDYCLDVRNKHINYLLRIFYGPFLLAYLANKSSNFLYIWSSGFLVNRDYEFSFLKSKRKKIVCVFVGDDIRSPNLLREYLKSIDSDGFSEYVGLMKPYYLTKEYDDKKRILAKSADMYADVIFSSNIDQMSYLESPVFQAPYACDIKKFNRNEKKFLNMEKVEVLHAPSNPLVKGTPLVRAAVKKLRIEGYDFNYTELQNVSNQEVLDKLRSSHIVLNQFYSFAPGMFAVEGMANHCAVLTSADPGIETALLKNFDDYWMITRYWEIYDNLKRLLDNHQLIKYYADKGFEFSKNNYTKDAASAYLNRVLNDNGIVN